MYTLSKINTMLITLAFLDHFHCVLASLYTIGQKSVIIRVISHRTVHLLLGKNMYKKVFIYVK